MKLTIDLETRSPVDLKKCGLYVYAEHPLTDVICLSVKVGNHQPEIWVNPRFSINATPFGLLSVDQINYLIAQADEIEAHNSSFERQIWEKVMAPRYGFSPIPIEKLFCSAAKAAALSLPRSLGGACKALGLHEQKSFSGYNLMLKMCKPKKPTGEERDMLLNAGCINDESGIWTSEEGQQFCVWQETEKDILDLCSYCIQDANSEYALSEAIPDLIKRERSVFLMDQRINDKGIKADVHGANKIISMVKTKEQKLLAEFERLTAGVLKSPRQTQKLIEWLMDNDIHVENAQKDTIKGVLKDLPDGVVSKVLKIRQSLSKASVSKYDALIRMCCSDGRVKGMFLYHGANTGRFASKGLQVHNLKRDSIDEDELDALLSLDMDSIEMLHDCVIILASKCVRGMLIAPEGKDLVAADLNAIESRVLAWIAYDHKMIDNYKRDLDAYKIAAEGIYNVKYAEVTKDQRQIGKVAELALGYQGHVGAFSKMAEGYGVKIKINVDPKDRDGILALLPVEGKYDNKLTDELFAMLYEQKVAEICNKWRRSRPEIVKLWADTEAAAIETIHTGNRTTVGRVSFKIDNGFLFMDLPSGRSLAYCKPSLAQVVRNGKEKTQIRFWGTESQSGKKMEWTQQATYGGKLVENAVQAISRDILVEGMARIERAGYAIVLHVHDEVVAEITEGKGNLKEFETLLSTTPSWANGLPMKAKGWIGKRYKKD